MFAFDQCEPSLTIRAVNKEKSFVSDTDVAMVIAWCELCLMVDNHSACSWFTVLNTTEQSARGLALL